jgi:hypothetical protein
MQQVRDMGLDKECFIMCGVGPLASARTAAGCAPTSRRAYSRRGHQRLEGAEDQKKEGKQLCIDIINEVKEIEGVSGIHVMAYRQEEFVAEIVHESGVLKGRRPWPRNPIRSMKWSPHGWKKSSTNPRCAHEMAGAASDADRHPNRRRRLASATKIL